ncbi:MAG: tetratricopeptide repeat protein, partial [Planctomycetaceae bacterium]|nr:tetratricopeptide repeat protein [Planctomycetaceae bacterium]
MVTSTSEFDLKQTVLFDGPFGPIETERLAHAVGYDFTQFEVLREAINELELKEMREELSPAGRVRLGVSLYLAGRYELSAAALKKGDSGALALYYLARSYFALRRYEEALKHYDLAQKTGYSPDVCRLGMAEVYRYQNHPAESLKELDKLSGAIEQTAEYLYQRGATIAMYGNLDEAVKLYERAVATDKNHTGALFGLALERERGGYDEEALDLYKRAVAHFPTNIGTLFNLGLLYEDLEQYDQAVI